MPSEKKKLKLNLKKIAGKKKMRGDKRDNTETGGSRRKVFGQLARKGQKKVVGDLRKMFGRKK